MPEAPPFSPLACFADFYEQVAAIKLAAGQGLLPAHLAEPGLPAPAGPAQVAARVQALLLRCMDQQQRAVALRATDQELKAWRIAQKVMAAVADEALLLNLEWEGREAWLGLLLEAQLFRTRNAGSQLFELADQLLQASAHNALQREVAAVLLFALQLGFKGRLRGTEGASTLERYRRELYKLAHQGAGQHQHPFAQAYASCLRLAGDAHLAPLGPWLRAALWGLGAWLLLSGLAWLYVVAPLVTQLAGRPA